MDVRAKLVLITGGSRGIGFGLARELALKGSSVWLLARDEERLRAAVRELESLSPLPSSPFGYLACDVTNEADVASSLFRFFAHVGTPDLLVNCAGAAHPGRFDELDSDVFRTMMNVNYFGTVNTCRAVVPRMMERGSGRVVNVSSVAGFLGVYGYTAYGAAKYAVAGFSDVLRSELKPFGVGVSVVFPPDTETEGFAHENTLKPFITKEIAGTAQAMSPGEVARRILRGVEKDRYIITPGTESAVLFRVCNLLGGFVHPVMDILVARAGRKEAMHGREAPAGATSLSVRGAGEAVTEEGTSE